LCYTNDGDLIVTGKGKGWDPFGIPDKKGGGGVRPCSSHAPQG